MRRGLALLALLVTTPSTAPAQHFLDGETFLDVLQRELVAVDEPRERAEFVRAHRHRLPDEADAVAVALGSTYAGGLNVYGPAEVQRATLLELLLTCGPAELRALAQACSEADDEARRCAALALGPHLEGRDDLAFYLTCLLPDEQRPDSSPRVHQLFEAVFTEWVRTRPEAVAVLRASRTELDTASLLTVMRSVGASRRPDALPLLERALFHEDLPRDTVLGELARLAPFVAEEDVPDLAETLIEYLDPTDPRTCRAAADALAQLGDRRPIPELIALLDAEIRAVSDGALAALRELTGATLRPDARRWETWYRMEQEWYAEVGVRLEEQLTARDPAVVAEALRTCTEHPLFAPDYAEGLGKALLHDTASVRLFAVHVINTLRPQPARPYLELAARDADDEVAAAATRVLEDWPSEEA